MKLSVKSLAITAGIVWGGLIFLIGIASLISPGYGAAMLELAASLYPGYHVGSIGSVFVGTLYAILDGVIVGAVFGWLYNRISGMGTAA
jgi:hypothetical protein